MSKHRHETLNKLRALKQSRRVVIALFVGLGLIFSTLIPVVLHLNHAALFGVFSTGLLTMYGHCAYYAFVKTAKITDLKYAYGAIIVLSTLIGWAAFAVFMLSALFVHHG